MLKFTNCKRYFNMGKITNMKTTQCYNSNCIQNNITFLFVEKNVKV